MRTILKAAPLAVLVSMIWLAPGCGGDEDSDEGSAGSAGTNVRGGSTGNGGEPASNSGGTGATGTGEGGASEGGNPGTGQGGASEGGNPGTGQGGASEGGNPGTGQGGAAPDCLGDPLPETAPDNVVVSGLVTTLGNVIISGVLVEGRAASGDGLLDDDTSGLNGYYELTLPTGGAPLGAYLFVSADGSVDTYVYPPHPFVDDDELDVPLITSALRTGIADEANVALQADKGLLYVFVLDCNGDPVQGATVTTNPAGEFVSYTEGFVPSPDATSTDGSGAAYVFNLPPGNVEVDATIDGYSLREHTIEVRANVMTITSVIP
ncbi:MAG TPA: carboxypeptidase-like regulatory domain-containing protein [Polyangiaceae bacterium]|nr:carboxypeptidase-like regulatory domain-containing protein [Polyangiaceae bacterium]